MKKFFSLLLLSSLLQSAFAADLVFVKQNSEPKYLADNSGLCDQIYSELAANLSHQGIDVTVLDIPFPIKRILVMLETGQAHVFCGAGVTEERQQKFNYSWLPVYTVSNVLLAHAEETEVPASFKDIAENKWVIGAFYGTSSATYLRSHDGVLVNDNFHDLEQVTQTIATKPKQGLRYFYYHDLGLNHYVQKSGLPLKVLPTKFRTVDQWLLLSKSMRDADRETLEQALAQLNDSGRLREIQAQFLSVD